MIETDMDPRRQVLRLSQPLLLVVIGIASCLDLALGSLPTSPSTSTTPKLAIVVPQGCHTKIRASEELHEECIHILKEHKYLQTRSARGEIRDIGCDAFPVFRKTGASLGYKAQYSASFRRVAPLLAQRGWNVTVSGSKPDQHKARELEDMDLIICELGAFDKMKKVAQGAKFILLATHDSAAISSSLDLEDDTILAFLQHTDFSNPEEHNMPTLMRRRHTIWIQENGVQVENSHHHVKKRKPKLSPKALGKIIPMIPQIQRWRYPLDCGGSHGNFAHFARSAFHKVSDHSFARELRTRPIDIAFAGNVHGEQREEMGINAHRQQAMTAIRRLARKHNLRVVLHNRDVPYETYITLLRSTKIFVSPFGIGEFSGKDYEAILAGALLVKPKANYLRAYPNIYDRKYTVSTHGNFHDLEAKVMPFLESESGITRAQAMVDAGRGILREYSSAEHFAGDVDNLLRVLLSRDRGAPSTANYKVEAEEKDI